MDTLPSVCLLAAADHSALRERATQFTLSSAVLRSGSVVGLCDSAAKRDGYVVTSAGSMLVQSLIKAMTSKVMVSFGCCFSWFFNLFWSKIPQQHVNSISSTQILSICVCGGGGVVIFRVDFH